MCSHDGVYLHSNATWLVESNLNCDSFVPRWPNQSCMSLLSSSQVFIIDWLLMFVNQTQEGAELKVPFAVTRH